MKTFKIIFHNKPDEFVEGFKIYTEDDRYLIADEDNVIISQFAKVEVKCISKDSSCKA